MVLKSITWMSRLLVAVAAPWPLRSRAWSPSSGNLGTTVLAKMFPCTTCNLLKIEEKLLLKKVHLVVLLK